MRKANRFGTLTIPLIVFSVLFALCLPLQAAEGSQQEQQSSPVAVVNGEDIAQSELSQRVKSKLYSSLMALRQAGDRSLFNFVMTPEFHALLESYVLEQMIEETLREQKIEELNLSVTEQEIDSRIDEIIKQYDSIKDREDLKTKLKESGNSLEDFRNSVKQQLLQEKLRDEVTGEITVSEEEIRQYYEKNKDSFKDNEGEVKPLEEVRDQIKQQLVTGKKSEKYSQWLAEIKEKATIKRNLPPLDFEQLSWLQ